MPPRGGGAASAALSAPAAQRGSTTFVAASLHRALTLGASSGEGSGRDNNTPPPPPPPPQRRRRPPVVAATHGGRLGSGLGLTTTPGLRPRALCCPQGRAAGRGEARGAGIPSPPACSSCPRPAGASPGLFLLLAPHVAPTGSSSRPLRCSRPRRRFCRFCCCASFPGGGRRRRSEAPPSPALPRLPSSLSEAPAPPVFSFLLLSFLETTLPDAASLPAPHRFVLFFNLSSPRLPPP